VENQVKRDGLTFAEGPRFVVLRSKERSCEHFTRRFIDWSQMVEGKWIKETLYRLRHPDQQTDKTFYQNSKKNFRER
jgi:hypothetical protein